MVSRVADSTQEFNNRESVLVLSGHYPAQSSTYNYAEFNEHIREGVYRDKDYGIEGNIAKYGTERPPVLELKDAAKSKVPILAISPKHDVLIPPKSHHFVKELLPENVVELVEINGGHGIHLYAKDSTPFKEPLLRHLANYNKI